MDKIKNLEMLTSSLTTPGEINFILLDSAPVEISSPQLKYNFRSELTDILRNDPRGTLLLPYPGSSQNKG
jgi:hypothetical protein